MMMLPAVASATTLSSLAVVVLGAASVRAFAAQRPPPPPPCRYPPVTVLKPLCGAEPMLEAALATICAQLYPGLQIVFGVQDADDPALQAVAATRRTFPAADITVVVNPHVHGPNRKISNLINMLPAARHDVLVLSDSDLHVPPDYIERIVAALDDPGVGLVTTLCTGLPTMPGVVSRLGATAITHSFLPGVLMSRALGRQDCLGTTMAVRRDTLARVGGLQALVRHVADDHLFARRIRAIGLATALAAVVPGTAVPEATFQSLYQHELRWARTIRGVEPGLFITSALQFPLFWSLLTVAVSGAASWSLALFAATWAVRASAACVVDRALGLSRTRQAVPVLLLPVRDLASVWLVLASYVGSRVVWRGRIMQVAAVPRSSPRARAEPAPPRGHPADHAGAGGNRPAAGR